MDVETHRSAPFESPSHPSDYDKDEEHVPVRKFILGPDYDKDFFGDVQFMEYYCKTSGSDGGKLCYGCFATDPHLDYNHDILLSKEKEGFTVNGGPLRRFDDPLNRDMLDAIYYSRFPKELDPKVEDTKLHKIIIRRPTFRKNQLEELPLTKSRIFEAGTPKEILDAAVADTPNSILIPIDSDPAWTRHMLFIYPPEESGPSIISNGSS